MVDPSENLPKQRAIRNYLCLEKPVETVKYVGPRIARRLKKLRIETVGDLLYHFPSDGKYLDRSKIALISQLKVGEVASVVGKVKKVLKLRPARKNIRVLKVGIFDGTGYLYGVWFNQDFIAQRLTEGTEVVFSGKVVYEFGELQIKNPSFDILARGDESLFEESKEVLDDLLVYNGKTVHTGRIVPIHPATKNLSPAFIRRIIIEALNEFGELPDYLPAYLRTKYNFLDLSTALKEIHFPTDLKSLKEARRRLLFDELFLIQLGLAFKKKRVEKELKGIAHKFDGKLTSKFVEALPFQLTGDQKRAIAEIEDDLKSASPMNRLLQGEVGSGKTVVAIYALLAVIESGFQAALMAPTEVLAEQHFLKAKEFLKGLPVKIALLTGSLSPKEKSKIQEAINRGEVNIVIGTHALIQEAVKFKKLGLAVIDEQHRFGVTQRIDLKEKGKQGEEVYPDILIMTATPIPRTLSLTLYGDLDVSELRELPAGRKTENVETVICTAKTRDLAYEVIREEVSRGHQAYIICPLIEESDKVDAKAVMDEAEYLKKKVFSDFRVAVLYGRMKSWEKEKIMSDFRQGKIDILISTTVIEVGIDVPNATVMMIENADRFGLSQLHQLRGRIGRGGHKSYCFLLSESLADEGKERMAAIASTTDGFELAEKDLEIRGEGELFGIRQSGLPDLKLARLIRDREVLIEARKEAFALIEKDPDLTKPFSKFLLCELKRRFGKSLDWLFHT